MSMTQTPSKTEQRIEKILRCLQRAYPDPVTYEELSRKTNTAHDVLLYVTTTLALTGHLERDEVADGPGRPRVQFTWVPDDLGSS